MKYYGKISDNNDLVTKKYVDDKAGSPFIVSSTPPSDRSKFWIKNGVPYYFDSSESAWITLKFTTDINKISVT